MCYSNYENSYAKGMQCLGCKAKENYILNRYTLWFKKENYILNISSQICQSNVNILSSYIQSLFMFRISIVSWSLFCQACIDVYVLSALVQNVAQTMTVVEFILNGFICVGATVFCMKRMCWELFLASGTNSRRQRHGKKLSKWCGES